MGAAPSTHIVKQSHVRLDGIVTNIMIKVGEQVSNHIEIREAICKVARSCGEMLIQADRESLRIESKQGQANFVTKYDVSVEAYLREHLLQIVPDAVFIGEESDAQRDVGAQHAFIVDPIDGTTNFIKDYHASAISIALLDEGQIMIGVVYNPYLNEMFWAERGKGAYCNGERIHVSDQPLENGLVLFGSSPYYKELWKPSFELAYTYFEKAMDIRRSGSAALDLCSIAAGRAEVYFELRLSPWDYAAGSLLVEEAGGVITDIDGDPIRFDRPSSILAQNKNFGQV